MLIIVKGTGRSAQLTRKRKESDAPGTGSFNERSEGEGSEDNSTNQYIKKLQAELAELKASHGIASSSHTVSHRQRGHSGTMRQVTRR